MPKQNYILFCIAIVIIILFHNTAGIAGRIAGGIIFLIFINLFKKDVALAFALCMVVNSNPFLILHPYTLGLSRYLAFGDVFYLLSFLVVFSPQVKERRVDYNIKKLLPVLFLFVLYQFMVSYLLKAAPDNIREILRLIYRQYGMYLGVFLVIPAYIVFKVDGKKLIIGIALASTIFTLALLINNYTPAKLFILRTEWRNGAVRTFLFQSHAFFLPTYVALAAFTFFGFKKAHIKYYIGGIATLTVPLLAMYRLELFTNIMTLFLVAFLVSKFLHRNLSGFARLFKALVLLIAMVLVLAPEFYYSMSDLYVNTFKELLGTGEVEKGTTQTRTEHELPLHLSMINENPILGNGWNPRWFKGAMTKGDWGFTDVPLTSTLAMYGWLGMLIYYSRLLFILPPSKRVLTAIGKDRVKIEKNGFHYIVILALRAYFIAMISFRLFYIGYELTMPQIYANYGTFLGIYFASIYMIESQNGKQKSIILF